MRFDRGRASHARYHNQYALLMAMGTAAGLLPGDAGPAPVRALAAPASPASSATPRTGWATTWRAGTTSG